MKLSAILEPLIAAGVPGDVILATVRAFEDQREDALERRRESDRNRQSAKRSRDVTGQSRDSRDSSTVTHGHELAPDHARVEDNLLPKKISGQEEKQDISPEAAKAAPVAFELPCVSGEPFPVYDADIAEWASSFPAVDIRQQLAAARSWLIANPTRRKTRRGMRKFIVAWLDRRQNAGGQPPARAGPAPQPRQDFNSILDTLQGKNGHDAYPGPTIDGGIDGTNRGRAANLVQLNAFPARR